MSTDDLLKMKRTGGVPGTALPQGRPRRYRQEALTGLAKLDRTRASCAVWSTPSAVRTTDEARTQDESVVFDLVRLLTGRTAAELAGVRGELEKLATEAKLPVTRQLGFVALIAADGNVDKAWALGTQVGVGSCTIWSTPCR